MEDTLKRQDNFYFQQIISQLPGHIYWKNDKGIFLGCNNQQAQLLGYENGHQIIGKTTLDMINPDLPIEERQRQANAINKTDAEVISSGKTKVIEEPLIRADGTISIFLSRKSPLYDSQHRIVGIIGTSLDITDKKQAEELRKEKDRKTIAFLKMAAGSIAHELRTPLLSIRLAVSALMPYLSTLINLYRSADIKKGDAQYIPNLNALAFAPETAKRSADQASQFIDLTLNNIRHTGDIDNSNFSLINMSQIIQQTLLDYPFVQQQQALVTTDLSQDFDFIGDETLMRNVLNNLIKNALYYIKAANKGHITITLKNTPNENLLIFTDTAQGAPSEVVEKMFDDFYTATDTGTGLGLSFCKRVMQSFSGKISASSKEELYMTFTLSFPIVTTSSPSSKTY